MVERLSKSESIQEAQFGTSAAASAWSPFGLNLLRPAPRPLSSKRRAKWLLRQRFAVCRKNSTIQSEGNRDCVAISNGYGDHSPPPRHHQRPVAAAPSIGETDHGGVRETVLNGKTGLLVPPRMCARADALADLSARPKDELAAMGTSGCANIVQNFSLERMCADTLAIYRELLGTK